MSHYTAQRHLQTKQLDKRIHTKRLQKQFAGSRQNNKRSRLIIFWMHHLESWWVFCKIVSGFTTFLPSLTIFLAYSWSLLQCTMILAEIVHVPLDSSIQHLPLSNCIFIILTFIIHWDYGSHFNLHNWKFTLQLHNVLRPRDILLKENETIARLNEKKFPEWATLQQNWVNTLISFQSVFFFFIIEIWT